MHQSFYPPAFWRKEGDIKFKYMSFHPSAILVLSVLLGPIRVPISHSTKEYLFPNPYICHVLRQINHAALIHGSDIPEFVPLRQELEKVVGKLLERGKVFRMGKTFTFFLLKELP